jgi:hypothetical protein
MKFALAPNSLLLPLSGLIIQETPKATSGREQSITRGNGTQRKEDWKRSPKLSGLRDGKWKGLRWPGILNRT